MRVLSLFSGVGGLELGLEWAGMTTVGQCEMNPFCQAVLEKHWPGMPRWDDVRRVTGEAVRERCGAVDVVCGGFPCQDVSSAGKGAGIEGERSGLWFEMLRVIREVRPTWVIAENVPALRTRGSDRVLGGLEEAGYACWPLVVGASDAGAPHRRKRVFIIGRRMDDAELHGRAATEVAGGAGPRADAPPGAGDAEQLARSGQRVRRAGAVAVAAGEGLPGRGSLGRDDGEERPPAERDGAAVAHAAGARRVRAAEREDEAAHHDRGRGRDAADNGGDVAHTGSAGWWQEGDRERVEAAERRPRHGPAGAGEGLADATQRGREAGAVEHGEAPPLGRLDADGRSGDTAVADAGSRLVSVPGRGSEGRAGVGPAGSIPLWPPGPSDRDAWARVLASHPWLAPAIEEAESRFRVVADVNTHWLVRSVARRTGWTDARAQAWVDKNKPRIYGSWRRKVLEALGNAVVPAVSWAVGRAVVEAERHATALEPLGGADPAGVS